MMNEFKKIQQSIDTYQALQTEQINSFETGHNLPVLFPDLALQSKERDALTGKLIRKINFFMKMVNKQNPQDSETMLAQVNDGLSAILEQNRILETKVRALRGHIEKNMSQVSKGKQVIGQYRSAVGQPGTPRVISITN